MTPPGFLVSSLYVAAGGALGSWLRYMVGRAWTSAVGPVAASAFPWASSNWKAIRSTTSLQ